MSARTRSAGWLLSLAFAGGAVDAISYLGIGKVFTANMTGNTVLLTVALARDHGADAARSAAALGGFCFGTVIGVGLIPPSTRPWPRGALPALAFEALVLAALLVAWPLAGVQQIRYELIATAGVAMGAQSAAVRASDVSGVNTTYMTSTLVNAITRLAKRALRRPKPDQASGLPGAAWVTYGVGALAGAFAVKAWLSGAVALPLAVVAATGATAGGRQKGG